MTEDQQHSHECHPCIITLNGTLHQDQYRAIKIDYYIHEEYSFPRALHTMLEINCFFRNICIPYQHILREPEIRPENRKCKHEYSYIMQMFLVCILEVSFIFKVDQP